MLAQRQYLTPRPMLVWKTVSSSRCGMLVSAGGCPIQGVYGGGGEGRAMTII